MITFLVISFAVYVYKSYVKGGSLKKTPLKVPVCDEVSNSLKDNIK